MITVPIVLNQIINDSIISRNKTYIGIVFNCDLIRLDYFNLNNVKALSIDKHNSLTIGSQMCYVTAKCGVYLLSSILHPSIF